MAGMVNISDSDPYWDNVISLLNFSPTGWDAKGNSWSTVGSAYEIRGSTDNYAINNYIYLPRYSGIFSTLGLALGTDDFTIEFHLMPHGSTTSPYGRYMQFGAQSWGTLSITNISNDNPPRFLAQTDNYGTNVSLVTNTIPNLVWSHICLVRQGNIFKTFYDGNEVDERIVSGNSSNITQQRLNVNFSTDRNEFFAANYANIRITKGVARYNSNFIPPKKPYPTK